MSVNQTDSSKQIQNEQNDIQSQVGALIFKDVKPYCVNLSQVSFASENVFNSKQLINALKDLDYNLTLSISKHSIEKHGEYSNSLVIPASLADYIFVPIAQVLKRSSISDTELEFTLSIVRTLIEHCWSLAGSLPMPLVQQFIPLITFLVGGKPNETEEQITHHSDETLLNGVSCLRSLLVGLENQGFRISDSFLTDNKNLPALGHMVSVLLNISLKSKTLEVQLECLETLNKLYILLHDGEILSFLLPGNASTIAKIIKSRPHYKAVCKSLQLLSTIMSYTFDDFDLNVHWKNTIESIEDLTDFEAEEIKTDDIKVFIPVVETGKVHRTTSWLRATLYQLKKALKLILNVGNLDRFEVRNNLFQFDLTILKNCFKSCELIQPLIVESVASLCSIDDSFVDLLLSSFSSTPNMTRFLKLLVANLNESIDAMPLELSSPIIEKSMNLMNRINLVVKLLTNFDNTDHFVVEKLLERLREELVLLVQSSNSKKGIKILTVKAQSYEVDMLMITSNYTNEEFREDVQQSKIMEGILDSAVENSLLQLMEALSSYSGIDSILDNMLVSLETGFNNENINSVIEISITLWICSTIAQLINSKVSPNTNETKMDSFLEFGEDDDDSNENDYMSQEMIHENTDLSKKIKNSAYTILQKSGELLDLNSTRSKDSLGLVKSTIISIRSIGQACDILGDEFKDELIDYLYPIIDNLASPNDLIRNEAQLVALKLADNLYEGSVKDLILENHDYLVDSLSVRLTGDSITPRTPMVLNVLIKICGLDLLNQLDDITVIIFTLLDLYHGYTVLCEGFFLVFREIIQQIYKHHFSEFDFEDLENRLAEDNVVTHSPWGMTSMDDVLAFLDKKIRLQDEILEESDSDDEGYEALKKDKILEVDSDDESDTELDSVPSMDPDNQHLERIDDDGPKWESPISPKLYRTTYQILIYSDRLSKHKSPNLSIITLKLINDIIPILATQKSKFLPLIASLWPTVADFLATSDDYRVIEHAFNVVGTMVKYANTFLSGRFVDLVNVIQRRDFFKKLITKYSETHQRKKESSEFGDAEMKVINRTSTSLNHELQTFEAFCNFLQLGVVKLGKLLSADFAYQTIKIAVLYDNRPENYGYFDDLVYFIANQN